MYCGRLESARLLDPEVISAALAADDKSTPSRFSMTSHAKLVRYPTLPGEQVSLPLGICLTEFHVIVAYVDRVKAINLLDDTAVFCQLTENALGGSPTGAITRDPVTGTVWLQGRKGVTHLAVDNEAVRIWRIYLERGDFESARKFCEVGPLFNFLFLSVVHG